MRRLSVLIAAFFLALSPQSRADEGMWLPFMINDLLYDQMQENGLNLTREQIFSFEESSLKDAIVSFGGGCTAEIISAEGLLLTNHHCGYGRIQYHSTPENDYLKNGFWAMSREEELPNPGLFVSFLVDVDDVTDQINEVVNATMSLAERNKAIFDKSNQLVAEVTKEKGYTANVRSMYSGNEFYLFVYQRFDDVRLVGTPPSSIGKFGGDTDNWMWPRHTGDFSLFRIYTAPDGSPAPYSIDNVPLVPKHFLPVSANGVKEGDFAMILGFPGSTDRYLTSWGIDYKLSHELPQRIDIRRRKLDVIEAAMAANDTIRIMYASRQSGISNYWKNFMGMQKALIGHNVADEKRILEENFNRWMMANPVALEEYGDLPDLFREAYDGYKKYSSFNFIHNEAITSGADILQLGRANRKLSQLMANSAPQHEINTEINNLKSLLDRWFRNYNQTVDMQLFEATMQAYNEYVPVELQPVLFAEMVSKYKGNFNHMAQDVYKKSFLASRRSIEEFLANPNARKISRDPAINLASAFWDKMEEINLHTAVYDEKLSTARRMFIKGLMEMDPDGFFYPDANSTMRFTFGSVRGYWPADAVYYDFATTLDGVIQKENPDHFEFVVPEKLSELHRKQDYGPWATDGTMVVNFISNNDITGGNSGSPVINGDGHLIGLAFDGNWDAMSGDILFQDRMQRTISVDVRYILFVIDKFAGASYLLDEMEILVEYSVP